jgi:class 3 adenylate cyclase/tetratricopeptide (TPR) repeat protein
VAAAARPYVPIDRWHALVSGRPLPTEVWGTALEADLSGFTALTESLAQQLGEQRGAEELTRRLNWMYDGLIGELHRFGATVLGFSGDAFTAWLDGDDGMRAVACAESLQGWMGERASEVSQGAPPPRIKVALATGTTRRFLVGDPGIQLLEGLAGSLVDEMAAVEHEADPGEIVLAESSRTSLGSRVETGDRGVLVRVHGRAAASPWRRPSEVAGELDLVRPWLLPAVFERLTAGEGDFLAELRPATALFLQFSGIGFDQDPDALERLDAFVRAVQAVLTRFEATLLQLTMGDKGSYLYAGFGAPVAHEDDRQRALLAAWELRALGGRRGPVEPVSIGVADGRLWAGAYGGRARRTYGMQGDTVNLAARLMQAAAPGEVVVTRELRQSCSAGFRWGAMADLIVKGKADPVAVAKLRGIRSTVGRPRRAPTAASTMLGRQRELTELEASLDGAVGGHGQVVAVTAEAGMGKTLLVSQLVLTAARRGIGVQQGECPSFAVNGSYEVWRPIWRRLLGVGDRGSARRRVATAAAELARADPALAVRVPLLGPLLGLAIPDNDLTRSFDAKVRKTSLEATVADWLRARVDRPMVFVLEDCHWIDALSEDLLEVVGRTAREVPMLVVVTHRPRREAEGGELAVGRLPHYREVALDRLSDEDVARLIDARLEQTELPRALAGDVSRLAERAEGNPFYVGELLDYIIELGPGALDPARLAELPSSLQSLVLSRIDRLDERPRSTLKVASAVGRVFLAELLSPVHRELGTAADVRHQLATLERADFVVTEDLDTARYAFTHAITQEVAYSTIVGATRAGLHGRIGRLLEERAGTDTDRQLDVLAYHFGRSDDDGRRRTYVLRAAEAAQARYANRAAAEYYRNVLALLDGAERGRVLVELGRVLELTGAWDEAAATFSAAYDDATDRDDGRAQAWAETEQGELLRKQGSYVDAAATFERAKAKLDAAGDVAGVAEVLHYEGTLAAQQQNTTLARTYFEQSLEMRRELGDQRGVARSLNGLGITAEYENELDQAAALYGDALRILTEVGDRWGVAALTNNAGMALFLAGRIGEARPLFERAVALQREIGDPHMLANFLSNLGDAARDLGDLDAAMRCYQESLVMSRQLGERWLITYLLEDVAMLATLDGRPHQALRLAAAAARLREEIGAPLPPESQRKLDERLEPARRALAPAERDTATAEGAALTLQDGIAEALAARDAKMTGLHGHGVAT